MTTTEPGTEPSTTEPTTTTTEPGTEPSTTTTEPSTTATDANAEVDKWKALARKHEQRAAANHAELETLRASQMTEQEKAVEDAKKAGAAEASSTFGQRLAAAEIRAALSTVITDPAQLAEVVEELNLANYVTDTGDVDAEKVQGLRTKFEKIAGKKASPNLHQGSQGDGNPTKSLDDRIAEAKKAGNNRLFIALQNQKLIAASS